MSDEQLSLVLRARDEMSQVVGRASQSLDKLGRSGFSADNVLRGIGQGLGIAGVLGVTNAVSTLTDVMGDAVRAAMEDERSQVSLGVVLRDNVAAWNGNTDAIEKALSARMRFGFADEDLRTSLGTLVAVTHDVDRALEMQSLAMNLARFRGIDLASASDAVAKAANGSTKALNAMVPATRGAASAADALAIATRTTAGQVEAFAGTSLGKAETASVRAGEALEKLGYTVLPAVAEGAGLLATAIELLTGPLQLLDSFAAVSAENQAAARDAGAQWTAQNAALTANLAASAKASADLAAATAAVEKGIEICLPPAQLYTGQLGRLWDTADGAWLALRKLHVEMGAGANYGYKTVVNAATGFVMTQDQVNQGIADGVRLHQDYLNSLNKTTTGTGGATRATQGLSDAVDRMIERLRALDAAQQTVFDRYLSNLNAVLDTQLRAIDAAQAQRDADRQAIADRRALAEATRDLAEAQASGDPEKVREAQQRLSDIRDRINEAAKRKEEDDRRKALEATKDYIAKVGELVDQATNRGALANTLAAREKSLLESRAKAVAAGNTDEVALIDAKLAAIRAAEVRNQQAMDIAKATTAVQVYTTVHTKIAVDGKTLAEIVDKYLGEKPVH